MTDHDSERGKGTDLFSRLARRFFRVPLQLRKERVELPAVVEAALETSRPVIEAGGHEFTVTLPPEPIHLEADPVRLAQVFANLLNNAVKYTEEGGRVRLSAAAAGLLSVQPAAPVEDQRDRAVGTQ